MSQSKNTPDTSAAAKQAEIEDIISRRAARVTDPRYPLLRASKLGGIAIAAMTVASLIAWGGFAGMAGIWGALIGGVLGGSFVLLTVIVVLATANTTPSTTMAVVLGSWLVKVLITLIVLVVLKGMTFYSTPALAITIIAALVVGLGSETWGVLSARVAYIADTELAEEGKI